jgi:uncharacterized protein with PQ loop repeat
VVDNMELIGYISGLMLAFCGLPEAIRSVRNKRCDVGWGLLTMWMLGEIGLLIYEFKTMAIPRLINYTCNIIFISIMIYWKVRKNLVDKCAFCTVPCNNSWCITKEKK